MSRGAEITQAVFGTAATTNSPVILADPVVRFPGVALGGEHLHIGVDKDAMSRHILLLGGSGCGKTNAFLYALKQLRVQMTERDVAIIFDTKGEFYENFGRDGDYVIGNSVDFRDKSNTWNIFDEIVADGWDDANITMNAREISAALFHGRGSETQPFFCNAARDIFAAILIHFVRKAKELGSESMLMLNNRELLTAFRMAGIDYYRNVFTHYDDLKFLLTYIGEGKSNQALGVFGELNSMINEYFIGVLADHRADRSMSMRMAVRERGGKAIFVEYDLSVGETLTPVYRLLVDQALKEALGRQDGVAAGTDGKVYLIADEFKLLPNLQHIDDALNFGRGMGVSVMAGIQSIDQLYDIYGESKGAVIASGFGSIFAFHTNDGSSRDYIAKRFGPNYVAYGYYNQQKNSNVESEREGNVVEEWDQITLAPGQAIIGLGHHPPFAFQFDLYEG